MFFKYLKQRKAIIFAPFVFAVIYAVVFYFYNLSLKAILYPFALCLFLGAFVILVDYYFIKKKAIELESIKNLSAEIIGDLPSSSCILDDHYKEIIGLLIESQKKSYELSNEKYTEMVDYYTVWAHQIKTPIAAMRLTLQNDDSELSRKLKNDLTRIEAYVEMVLAFLRLDSTTTDYMIKEYNLEKIVRESVRKFSGEFIAKKLSVSIENINISVLTDEKWLSFIVEQIISNALKYTKKGGIRIYIAENKTLCINDTGIGILKSDLPRIFEKGYTGSIGRKDKKASGIGLYLCKRICDNLGHKISVLSEDGVGTTVKINLETYDTIPE